MSLKQYISFYLSLFFNPVVIGILLILLFYYIIKSHFYKKTSYYKVTKNGLLAMLFNTGKHGEYETYRRLRRFEKSGCKFLFNVYIPLEDGKTSEIDLLMISSKGIFVFESKNYSGWIFGGEL